MRISILLLSLLLLNCLQQLPFINAFQTTTYSRHGFVPQSRQGPSSMTTTIKTLVHRSSSSVVALASSNNEDEKIASSSPLSSELSESAQEEKTKQGSNENENQQRTYMQSQSQSQSQSEPTVDDLMLMMGTNPRRILLSLVSGTGIALAGNLFGVTSKLLTAVPEEQVEATGLDTYFPRGDYKRCKTQEYTFVLPKEWVADTYVELAKAQRKVQPLDYSMQEQRSGKITTLPDSAYGPPGRLNQKGVSQTGAINVSVIVSSGFSGFTLRGTLGTARDAAETLLSKSIAPEGSGKTANLLRSIEETRNGGQTVYVFEYTIEKAAWGQPLRNIAVIAASPKGDKLYTLTVVAPDEKWKDANYDTKLRKIADSFHLR